MEKKISVVGGDRRQACLCELLAADGYEVAAFGLGEPGHLQECVADSSCVILPVSCVTQEGSLHMPLCERGVTPQELFEVLAPGQLVAAGRVPPEWFAQCNVVDYATREDFTVANAIPTVEGGLAVAMERTEHTLHGARCLVIGFGRIGKLLCHRLTGLGARVCAAARKAEDFAWIRAYGYAEADTRRLEGRLGSFDLIFNTVPHMVLDGARLREVKKGCLCIDLASAPGGIHFEMARILGVPTAWALSLPGKVAPRTAACIVRDTVYNILEERELL